jgi:NAD(P)-dependent dehydrogenase (short-subunit alcohol dehydrogenase family)
MSSTMEAMNKWVLVTGAARRIGRAIALDLAAHGWDIIVHYHKSSTDAQKLAEEIQGLGRSSCLAEIDLSDAKITENLIPSLAEELGMIDALVNNASIFEPDDTDPLGTRHWAVNADAPRLLSKSFRDHLPPDEKGVIINLLDAFPTDENFAGYNRSKLFLADMTRNMAKSFAPQVRVNGVAPGFILPSARQSEASFIKLAGDRRMPPEQVALAVRRLIEAKGVTGEIVAIDGKAA